MRYCTMLIFVMIGCAALFTGAEAAHFNYTDEDFCFDLLFEDAWTTGVVTLDEQTALDFTTKSMLEVFEVVRAGLPLAAPRYMWYSEFSPDVGNEAWLKLVCEGWTAGGAESYRQQHLQNILVVDKIGAEIPGNLTLQFTQVTGCHTLEEDDWHSQMVFAASLGPAMFLLDCTSKGCRLAIAVDESVPTLDFDCEVPSDSYGNNGCSTNADCQHCNGDYACYIEEGGTAACAPDQSGHLPQFIAAAAAAAGAAAAAAPITIGILGGIAANEGIQAIKKKCFPGNALVVTEGGAARRMDELRMGDRVQVVDGHGRLSFQDIYVFGHADAVSRNDYMRLELQGGATIELTPDHFLLPVCAATTWGACAPVRSAEISVGTLLYATSPSGGGLEPVPVVAVSRVERIGAFNPYTAAGTIVVQGVVASVHSAWFLDGAFDALGLTHCLPAVYQVILMPVRILYYVLKALNSLAVARALEAALADTIRNVPVTFLGANAAVVSVAGVAAVVAAWSKVPMHHGALKSAGAA